MAALLAAAPLAAAPTRALGLFAQGVGEYEKGRYGEAARSLEAARPGMPKLADHAGYWLAAAHLELKEYGAAAREIEAVWTAGIASPYNGRAALLAGRAHRESGSPREAIRILRDHYRELPQPEGDALLASCYEAAGDPPEAVMYYHRVYYGYPASAEADNAAVQLSRLKAALGASYSQPAPRAMLDRAGAWLRAGQYRRAKSEFEALARQLSGVERELALVRVGAVEYQDYETMSAAAHLKSIETSHPEADAERLYYLVECARRLDRDDEMMRLLERLSKQYPDSPWRLKALVSVGNRYLLQNRHEVYEPLYRACAETFPADPQAAYCHWKVVWNTYLRRRPEAAQALRDHLLKFPGSEKNSAALYFLGRLAEAAHELPAAKAYYEEAVERFANHYYSMRAEERLARPEFLGAVRSESVTRFLERVVWPVRLYPEKFEPSAPTKLRLERARLLRSADLDELAETELRFGARHDEQPHILAFELAQMKSRGAPPHQPVQLLKALVPAYLALPLDDAPEQFWKLLFPMPFRGPLESSARQQRLDPFLVAGLIRQESEFNPGAISPAKAYGLTQILPSYGRTLMRKLGQKRYRPSMLFQPTISLRLGTFYLRSLLDENGGRLEETLAAYNAGPSRVELWRSWARYEDPTEFIETIPFTETRTYVVAVLRNAEIYRRLYGAGQPALAADHAAREKKPVANSKPFKRNPVPPKRKRRK